MKYILQYFLQYFLPISPFLTEIITDWVRIYIKKEADWFRGWHRVGMILAVTLIYILTGDRTWEDIVKFFALSIMPYCFFDPLLNIMRGKNWGAPASSKAWDRWLSKYDAEKVMYVRILVAVLMIGLMIWL